MSGYSGACQFFYSEFAPFFPDGEDELPAQIGAVQAPLSQQEARKAIGAAVTEGKLPHIPVTLGDRMTDVVDRYRLLRTPDEFPAGAITCWKTRPSARYWSSPTPFRAAMERPW